MMKKMVICLFAASFVAVTAFGAIAGSWKRGNARRPDSWNIQSSQFQFGGGNWSQGQFRGRINADPTGDGTGGQELSDEPGDIRISVTVEYADTELCPGDTVTVATSIENLTDEADIVHATITLLEHPDYGEYNALIRPLGFRFPIEGGELYEQSLNKRLPRFLRPGRYEVQVVAETERGGRDEAQVAFMIDDCTQEMD